MKIAAIVPVGYLDRHGYQHTYRDCLDSITGFADRTYIVQSVREDTGAQEYARKAGNLARWISDESTWFARTPDGSEWFDAYKVMENVNSAARLASWEDYDVAVCLMCNNYVPAQARRPLRERAAQMIADGASWDWLYRRDQLADWLFSASVRLPFMVNLADSTRFSADSLSIGGELQGMQRGDYREHDDDAIVDVQLEMTMADLRDKMTFIRNYRDLVPKRPADWDWGYWREYYIAKFRQKRRAGAVTDPTGRAIAVASQPEYVSRTVLEAL